MFRLTTLMSCFISLVSGSNERSTNDFGLLRHKITWPDKLIQKLITVVPSVSVLRGFHCVEIDRFSFTSRIRFFFPEVGNIVFRGNDCLRASKPTKTKNFFKYYENQAKQTNKQNFNTTKNIVQQNTKTSDGLG